MLKYSITIIANKDIVVIANIAFKWCLVSAHIIYMSNCTKTFKDC